MGSRAIVLVVIVGALTAAGCSLDWPAARPPDAGAHDASPDAPVDAPNDAPEAAPPSDCERCSAVAKYARPDAPPEGATHDVPAGGDLQAALDAAAPGDEIVLQAGATYPGSFHLPVKLGDQFITIRSSAASSLPGPCTRIGPGHFAALPKLIAPVGKPAVLAADGAHHYRLVGLELTIEPGSPLADGVVQIGLGSETDPALVPHHVELDRVYVHGDAAAGSRHGVVVNGGETLLINSWVSDVKNESDYMSAVKGWNGPGPIVVLNDHLESAGSTVALGEGAPSIAGVVPSDIEIGYSDFVRPLAWNQDDPTWDGSAWRTAAAVIVASGRRVTVEGNTIENCWDYYPVRLQPGSDSTQSWGVVEDVTIAANEFRSVAAGILIQSDSGRSVARVSIRDNVWHDIGAFGGEGRLFLFGGATTDLHIEHNTALQPHTLFNASGPSTGFVFDDNIVNHGEYGMFCDAIGAGTKCLDALFPGYDVRGNVIVGLPAGYSKDDYPPENSFPAYAVGFVDEKGGDYHLAPSSPFKGEATDGADPGVRFDAQDAAAACRTAP